tara:strand:- start:43499 stop:44791 length:1293 start_codon:yes stop_codon:yes gene_type:complete
VFQGTAFGQSIENRRAELEAELSVLEAEIAAQQELLRAKQNERVSLERDVAILDAKIERARLAIRARNISIQGLTDDIYGKELTIGELTAKFEREKDSLAQLIRRTNEIDHISLVEVILSNQNLSDFFEDLDSFDSIKLALKDSFEEIEVTKEDTEVEKSALEERRLDEVALRSLQELEKKKIEQQEAEKQKILKITKGVEDVYQNFIRSKEKSAAEIYAELFTLRGTAPIPFADAYRYATDVSNITGVRAAFILGVIAQESNLGQNVGQCLITNSPNKGDGKGVNTGRFFSGVMKSTRDVDPFFDIVNKLGINPYAQVVSCPPSYGYGGAMGPAQFIPSTWVLYEDRIAKAAGQNPPNPWDPRTAFIASALLLMDNGADRGTFTSERLAALRYFAGWRNAEKRAYAFYGDEVMELASFYQNQIDILQRG